MSLRLIVPAALLLSFVLVANAQNREHVRIHESAVVTFSWDCTKTSCYANGKFDRLIRPMLPKDWPPSLTYGDRAFRNDLNGDGKTEYFVPLFCGAQGNCYWAILASGPVRLLGKFWGESFYIHRRVARWSRISISRHLTASDAGIDTLRFEHGRYRKFGPMVEANADRKDFPRSLENVPAACEPN